jgi:hypothetical protein
LGYRQQMHPLALDEIMRSEVKHDGFTHLLQAHCKIHRHPFP